MVYNIRDLMLQIFGKKNLFGYSKTILNQLHLMYWFLGEFYQSQVFNRRITSIWRMQNISAIITVIVHGTMFLIFSSDQNLSQMLFAIVVLIAVNYILIAVPLGSHLYHGHMLQAFKFLDEPDNFEPISVVGVRPNRNYHSWVLYLVLTTQLCLPTLYASATYYNLFVTYDVDRLCNPEYFLFPLYCEYVRSSGTFLALQGTQFNVYLPGGPLFYLIPLFTYFVSREFYFKFRTLSDAIRYRSELFRIEYESATMFAFSTHQREVNELQREFVKQILEFARYHRTVLKHISHLRLYLEFNMSASLICLVAMEILVVFILLLVKKESALLTMRFLVLVVTFGTIQFVYCLAAKFFDDMADTFENTIQDIPWYYLPPSSRKSVQLLLYQAQVNVEFKALKIYQLNMGFFLRSCNNVYSVVNVLRRKTSHKN